MARLFSDDAKRARRKALRRRPVQSDVAAPFKTRLEAFVIAAAGSVFAAISPQFAMETIRRWIGSGNDAAVLWWPGSGPLGLAPALFLGLLAAFARGRFWPMVRPVWTGLAVVGFLCALPSLGAAVGIYPDRAVSTASSDEIEPGMLHFRDAAWVEVRCSWINRRRDSDIPTLTYVIHFPDGQRLDLTNARKNNHDGARAWFRAVEKLDRTALADVPHGPASEDRPGVQCLRALRSELGPGDFPAARRMLGVTDADMARIYSEPHEAWRRSAADGG